MTFLRSNSGETNKHLFHRVDFVVYVEGGASVNTIAALKGEGDWTTNDVFFWSSLFERYAPNHNVHLRSAGSKSNVKALLQKLTDGSVENVIICLDRDFDHLLGKYIDHDRVIYSKGYSWENDVFGKETTAALVRELYAAGNERVERSCQELLLEYRKFLIASHRWVRADAAAICVGCGLFDRKKHRANLHLSKTCPPTLNIEYLKKRGAKVRCQTETPVKCPEDIQIEARFDMLGHLLCVYSFNLANFFNKKISSSSGFYNFDMFVRRMLGIFSTRLSAGEEECLDDHYRGQFRV
ncbi:MAG: DUF4435 domain-containing protein [Rhodospirillales bacterium]|nr:DUF4435 domain-containing protein [Rhodospirillales bacterium]